MPDPRAGAAPELTGGRSTPRPSASSSQPLSAWQRIGNIGAVPKLAACNPCVDVGNMRWLNNPLLVPTFTSTVTAFVDAIASGVLPADAASLRILLAGYALGILLSASLTIIAISTRIGTDLLELLTSMFNPLPAIALLPLALLWFGLGYGSIVFVIIHSVLWAVALNTHSGFLGVSNTLRMVGRNYGLSGLRYVGAILIPPFPGHPYRTQGGLGVRVAHADRHRVGVRCLGIRRARLVHLREQNQLEIPSVFAGLFTVIPDRAPRRERRISPLAVTVRLWGMQSG
jgi:NitT/TauT family transport system permease protein